MGVLQPALAQGTPVQWTWYPEDDSWECECTEKNGAKAKAKAANGIDALKALIKLTTGIDYLSVGQINAAG